MPQDLKEEIKKIADVEHRTLSNTIELLLKNAVSDYWKAKKSLIGVVTSSNEEAQTQLPEKRRRAS